MRATPFSGINENTCLRLTRLGEVSEVKAFAVLPRSSLLLLAGISLQGWDGAPFPHPLLWMEISAVIQVSALGVRVVRPSRLWDAGLLRRVRGLGAET